MQTPGVVLKSSNPSIPVARWKVATELPRAPTGLEYTEQQKKPEKPHLSKKGGGVGLTLSSVLHKVLWRVHTNVCSTFAHTIKSIHQSITKQI